MKGVLGGEGGIRTLGRVAPTPDFEYRSKRCEAHLVYHLRVHGYFV